ncbi:MAG: tRNA uridine(34) 5-carboxymethylaminomethyl modification radical SAM/GNAT enzyme Elp3, partial [Thermoplasmata archaeon]|nr:tRNA uridine(34) 5-carboxymethylaminomethyl modification radical SAM/GNAT enzyme Elp3 [Thermoplasmata archaeon]
EGLAWQHRGLGTRLLHEVEAMASGWGLERLAIMAGMGTRGYFRGRGYSMEGPYMVRTLD